MKILMQRFQEKITVGKVHKGNFLVTHSSTVEGWNSFKDFFKWQKRLDSKAERHGDVIYYDYGEHRFPGGQTSEYYTKFSAMDDSSQMSATALMNKDQP